MSPFIAPKTSNLDLLIGFVEDVVGDQEQTVKCPSVRREGKRRKDGRGEKGDRKRNPESLLL